MTRPMLATSRSFKSAAGWLDKPKMPGPRPLVAGLRRLAK
jgi:hypothetical protein